MNSAKSKSRWQHRVYQRYSDLMTWNTGTQKPSIKLTSRRPLPKNHHLRNIFWLIDFLFVLHSSHFFSSAPFYQHNRIFDVYFHCRNHRALLDYCSIHVVWAHEKAKEEIPWIASCDEFNWSLKMKTMESIELSWCQAKTHINWKVFLFVMNPINWNREKCGKRGTGTFSLYSRCEGSWRSKISFFKSIGRKSLI